MRKSLVLVAGMFFCLFPATSQAVNVVLPTKDATLNIQFYAQPRFQFTEDGAPTGSDPAYDFFVRRTRVQANGSVGNNWLYLIQVDNANFGRYGNFTGRMIVQDAWVSWGPGGTKGDNVLLIEGGLVFFPVSRFTISSSGNYPNIDGHADVIRGLTGSQYPANRTTGLQIRGWALNKKIGFRGGIYEGVQPTVGAGLNPHRYPALAGFVNFDLIGSEEGGYLYQGMLWTKDPVLSVSVSGGYQSQALRTLKGAADMRQLASTVFLDVPFPGDQELAAVAGGYLYGNGTGSKDTGMGASVDIGYRIGPVHPYVSYEYFSSDDCTPAAGEITAAQCAQAHTADSRNFRAGVKFHFNKSLNHLDVEFGANRGQSQVGLTTITPANAGYTPPLGPSGLPFASLGRSPNKTVTAQWTFIF
ncbi:MAG TPA: hypothetical protein VIR81_14600 [Myxococcales bacterium]|nr:hypothetical protein [Myxococcales bacterium]